jgi:hypothetical protein
MKFHSHLIPYGRARSGGFSLVELLVAVTASVFVIAAIATLSIISVQNFVATSNYVQMNDQGRNALDLISREIRNATAVTGFSTNVPEYLQLTNSLKGSGATINFSPGSGLLTLTETGQPTPWTLLTGCDSFSFQLFDRYPLIVSNSVIQSNSISFHASTNITGQVDKQFCKVINLTWHCSRTILGSKLNTEIVQTAQVVLRNQVSQ